MATANLKNFITDEDRLAAWKFGSASKVAEMGMTQAEAAAKLRNLVPGTETETEKTADGGTILKILNPVNIAKAIAAVSIIGGIPVGVAAHAFDRRASRVKNDEKKLELEADYYRDASSQLEDGMRASGMRV